MSESSESMEESLGTIGQIGLTVTDLARSIVFYRDTLGLEFLFEVPSLAFFNCDGVRLMLGLPENSEAGPASSIIYFKVVGLHVVYGQLTERGVQFLQPPHLVAKMSDHDLWMAFFQDPDRNTLALMSEVRV